MDSKSSWNCPNDRELTLRARLETGWSVKSSQIQNNSLKSDPINESEQQIILQVINKSQQIERTERERIDRMLERLNNMKRNAKGDGKSSCVLCTDQFGLFGAQGKQCKDCLKSVCNKCGVDTSTPENDPLWLCKICSETREIWKKSGAWFSHTVPNIACGLAAIPSISSPANDSPNSTNSTEQEYISRSSSFRSTSPVLRRKTRSPSPRTNRNRSPQIADYSTLFDGEKQNEFYDQISREEYANLSAKQSNLYNNEFTEN